MLLLFYGPTSYGIVSSRPIALTTTTVSVSMPLSSAATNRLASLCKLSRFTVFVLTDKTASTALRLNCLLRSCFVKSNSTHDANRLSINVSRISFDQWSRQSKRHRKIPNPKTGDSRHLSMRTAGSHNCSRSAPALQFNVDLLSAKGS